MIHTEYDLALEESIKFEDLVRDQVRSFKAGSNEADITVDKFIRNMLVNEKNLERGQILTPILRLPAGFHPVLLERLKDDGPWKEDPIRVKIQVKNVSSFPLQITTSMKSIRRPRHKNAFVSSRFGKVSEHRTIQEALMPDKTMFMSVHYAIVNLRAHSRDVYPVELWESSGAIPKSSPLVESGYKAFEIEIQKDQLLDSSMYVKRKRKSS